MQLCHKCGQPCVDLKSHECYPEFIHKIILERVCLPLKGILLRFVVFYHIAFGVWPVLNFSINFRDYSSWADVVRCKTEENKKGNYSAQCVEYNLSRGSYPVIYEVIDPIFDLNIRNRSITRVFGWNVAPNFYHPLQNQVINAMQISIRDFERYGFNGGHDDTDLPFGGWFRYHREICPILDNDIPDGAHANHLGACGGCDNSALACRIRIIGTYANSLVLEKFLREEAMKGIDGSTLFSCLPMELINVIVDEVLYQNWKASEWFE